MCADRPLPHPVAAAGGRSAAEEATAVRPRDTRSHDRPRSRARLAARHAERLYPGALGRLVAHELVAYAESVAGSEEGLAESVIAEVLDRTPPRPAD
jgi:hypothetical protein